MDVARLAARVEACAARVGFSGTVLLKRDGADLFSESWGLANRADGIPVTRSTRFGLASLSKLFTAVAIGRLVDAGAVEFATPVSECLPSDARPRDFDSRITIHHLLTHSSGLADYFEESEVESNDEYGRLWETAPSYRFRRPADFLPLFADLPRRADPGDAFSYNNAGFILLGLVAETVTSSPFIDVIEREVLEPAGMVDGGYFALDEVRPRIAIGYVRRPDGSWRTNTYSIPIVGGGDGGAFATADDLARFFDALESARLLTPATTSTMLSPHVHVQDEVDYGYGFWLGGEGRLRCFGGVGEDPGAAARAFRWPELGITAIVLSNVSAGASDVWKAIDTFIEESASS